MPDAVAVLPPGFRLLDANGSPVAGGSLEFYAAGTTNARTVYSDSGLTTALGTVVYLDSGGHPVSTQGGTNKVVVYTGTTAYKVIAKDSDGATVWTLDNILGALDTSAFDTEFAKLEIPATVKSASYTATVSDLGKSVDCDTTSGNITVVLPSAVTAGDGATITIKKTAATNTVTISPVSGQTIDGAGSKSLTSINDSVTLRSNGANWREFAFARPSLSSGAITSDVLDSRVVGGLAQVGDVKLVPYSTVPDGWLECDGSAVSRTTYSALFAKIGITHGQGNGTTTFNLPDYRGRFLRVWDHGAGRDADAASRTAMATGGNTGDNVGSVQADATRAHNHSITYNTSTAGSGGAVTVVNQVGAGSLSTNTGTSSGSETRPNNAYLMAIILADPAAAGGAADFVHTVHSVSGVPSPSLGIDGDFAIDYTNWNIYGPKASGAWGSATSLIGPSGVASGIRWNFDTSTTMADPGTGDLRLNNATLASVTSIAVSALCSQSGNPDVSDLVVTWDDSTSTVKGSLLIKKASAPQNFAAFDLTALTDNSTWLQFTVTHRASSGSFSSTDALSVEFYAQGNVGTTGASGTAGANGTDPGIRWLFDSSTTTNADPGTGDLRLNNGTLSSVTEIAISYSSGETSNPSVENFVKAWDDSTTTANRGLLVIKKPAAPQNYAIYRITSAITDGTTYGRFTISHISSNGSFSAADVLSVQFFPTGDKGADGAGTGDVVGPAASVDGEIALYDSTTGKLLKRASTTGLLKATSGVLAAAVAGTDYQAADAELAAIAGLTSAADRLPYFTGSGTAALATFTAAGRALVDDADAAAQRTTLGLGTAAVLAETTTAEYRANTADRALSTDQVWAAADLVTLTDAATVAVDMSTGINFTVTLGGNRTLGAPTNTKNGQSGVILVKQDGTGSRTLAYNSVWKWAGGTAPTLTTTASRTDKIFYLVESSTIIHASIEKDSR